jgi:hypothetical protein
MKYIITICAWLALTLASNSQKTIFLRVFDETGKKIQNGFLRSVSDSSLTIQNGEKTTEVLVSKISVIKVKRSFGHTVAISSGIGAAGFAIFGAATADPEAWIYGYTAGEGAAIGFIFGTIAGATVGSIIGATNKRPVLQIKMNQEKWMKAKSALSYYLENMPK